MDYLHQIFHLSTQNQRFISTASERLHTFTIFKYANVLIYRIKNVDYLFFLSLCHDDRYTFRHLLTSKMEIAHLIQLDIRIYIFI